jgi:hypothetical protein
MVVRVEIGTSGTFIPASIVQARFGVTGNPRLTDAPGATPSSVVNDKTLRFQASRSAGTANFDAYPDGFEPVVYALGDEGDEPEIDSLAPVDMSTL